MLGYHTKLVNTYGKRRQRIVNVDPKAPPTIFDDLPPTQWAPVASRMKKRENGLNSQSPKILHMNKKKPRLSPPMRKALPQIRRLEEEGAHEALTPVRRPLGVRALNTPGSPAVANKARLVPGKGLPPANAGFSPFVDILVLDDQGKTVSQELRISGPRFSLSEEESPPPRPRAPRRGLALKRAMIIDSEESESDDGRVSAVHEPQIDDDGGDDSPPPPRKVIKVKKAAPPLTESDESDSDDSFPPAAGSLRPSQSQLEVVITRRPVDPIAIPTTPIIPIRPEPPIRYQRAAFPHPRPRQLTPIGRRNNRLYAPPSPPSPLTSTDGDLTIDLSSLSISLSPSSGRLSLAEEIPEYLQPLLAECGQSTSGLHEFSSFIRSFPYDSLVSARQHAGLGFRKIGEASYSEVFGIGDVVLKVIPLRDEAQRRLRANAKAAEVDGPAETDAKDVLKEIIVTRAMGEVCDGFVKLLRAYVVRGTYPQVLLELWDEYSHRKGSEGVRPDTFAVSQAYAIIVLPNGGPDLEAYSFAARSGWKQACSVFWQVAKALAHAEQLVSFEHRDLHLGQILVRDVGVATQPLQAVSQNRKIAKPARPLMDDPVHGVRATLIDLGLSRMDAGDGSGGEMVHWTPFEEEIFMGEGDYQFDIYRYMRDHNGSNWEAFSPLTNALWLHYLVVKLLNSKGLKAPARRKTPVPPTPSVSFTERDCYDCLVDLEDWLGNCVAAIVEAKPKGKGRKKKTPAAAVQTSASLLRGPLCAGEVVGYGVKKGWVKSLAE